MSEKLKITKKRLRELIKEELDRFKQYKVQKEYGLGATGADPVPFKRTNYSLDGDQVKSLIKYIEEEVKRAEAEGQTTDALRNVLSEMYQLMNIGESPYQDTMEEEKKVG